MNQTTWHGLLPSNQPWPQACTSRAGHFTGLGYPMSYITHAKQPIGYLLNSARRESAILRHQRKESHHYDNGKPNRLNRSAAARHTGPKVGIYRVLVIQ